MHVKYWTKAVSMMLAVVMALNLCITPGVAAGGETSVELSLDSPFYFSSEIIDNKITQSAETAGEYVIVRNKAAHTDGSHAYKYELINRAYITPGYEIVSVSEGVTGVAAGDFVTTDVAAEGSKGSTVKAKPFLKKKDGLKVARWVNYNGTLLGQTYYEDGNAMSMDFPGNKAPEWPSDGLYNYTFRGWSAPVVNGDVTTFTAQYTPSAVIPEEPDVPPVPVVPSNPLPPNPNEEQTAYVVNADIGSDTNPGTEAAPLATVERAFELINERKPINPVHISLMSDVIMTNGINVNSGSDIILDGQYNTISIDFESDAEYCAFTVSSGKLQFSSDTCVNAVSVVPFGIDATGSNSYVEFSGELAGKFENAITVSVGAVVEIDGRLHDIESTAIQGSIVQAVAKGTVKLLNTGEITNNKTAGHIGMAITGGTFDISGKINNNTAGISVLKFSGGVGVLNDGGRIGNNFVNRMYGNYAIGRHESFGCAVLGLVDDDSYGRSVFTMNGGAIEDNIVNGAGGCIVINDTSRFIMEGGSVSGNKFETNVGAICFTPTDNGNAYKNEDTVPVNLVLKYGNIDNNLSNCTVAVNADGTPSVSDGSQTFVSMYRNGYTFGTVSVSDHFLGKFNINMPIDISPTTADGVASPFAFVDAAVYPDFQYAASEHVSGFNEAIVFGNSPVDDISSVVSAYDTSWVGCFTSVWVDGRGMASSSDFIYVPVLYDYDPADVFSGYSGYMVPTDDYGNVVGDARELFMNYDMGYALAYVPTDSPYIIYCRSSVDSLSAEPGDPGEPDIVPDALDEIFEVDTPVAFSVAAAADSTADFEELIIVEPDGIYQWPGLSDPYVAAEFDSASDSWVLTLADNPVALGLIQDTNTIRISWPDFTLSLAKPPVNGTLSYGIYSAGVVLVKWSGSGLSRDLIPEFQGRAMTYVPKYNAYVTFMAWTVEELEAEKAALSDGTWKNSIVYDVNIKDTELRAFDTPDINFDGTKNIYDSGYLMNVFRGTPAMVSGIADGNTTVRDNYIRCDLNADGMVDSKDYLSWSDMVKPEIVTAKDFYISSAGSDANDGSEAAPFATVNKAFETADASLAQDVTVHMLSDVAMTGYAKTVMKNVTFDGGGYNLNVTGESCIPFTVDFDGNLCFSDMNIDFTLNARTVTNAAGNSYSVCDPLLHCYGDVRIEDSVKITGRGAAMSDGIIVVTDEGTLDFAGEIYDVTAEFTPIIRLGVVGSFGPGHMTMSGVIRHCVSESCIAGEVGSTLVINNGKILNNTIDNRAVSMLHVEDGIVAVTMNDGEISGNTPDTGSDAGAVYCDGVFVMNDGLISKNVGIYGCIRAAGFEMHGGKIVGNAVTNGGGVYVGNFTMSGGEISDNRAQRGGGVYVADNFTMTGGKIVSNAADVGGGVWCQNGSFTMVNGEIYNNIASERGDDICIGANDGNAIILRPAVDMNAILASNGRKITQWMQDGNAIDDTIFDRWSVNDYYVSVPGGKTLAGGDAFDFCLKAAHDAYCTVTFSCGYTGGIDPDPVELEKGGYVDCPEVPTRNGYTFEGWLAEDGYFDFGEPIEKDVVLVAQWGQNVPDIGGDGSRNRLSYSANGGSGAPAPQTGNGPIMLQTDEPVREGYAFKGWSTDAGATEAEYQPGDVFVLTRSVILYAVWAKQVQITFNVVNGVWTLDGSVSSQSITVTLDETGSYVIPDGMVPSSTPNAHYIDGVWRPCDPVGAIVTEDTIFTYTYTKAPVIDPLPMPSP